MASPAPSLPGLVGSKRDDRVGDLKKISVGEENGGGGGGRERECDPEMVHVCTCIPK